MEDNKKENEELKENKSEPETAQNEDVKPETPDETKNDRKKDKKKENKELEEQKKKFDELNDKYLRLAAEYDNYRKRSVKEKELAYADAYADALALLLPIADNLDRAIVFANDDSDLSKGLKLLYKQFGEALAKAGVEEIEAQGQTFDPQLHNAVMHEESEEVGENTVTMVLQKGYKRQNKVLRHAMVKVAN